MTYMGVASDNLIGAVITQEEFDFVSGLRIPANDINGLWLKKRIIDRKIVEALESGKVERVSYEPVIRQNGPQIISDYAGSGINGFKSMADGKYYDSKSAYRKDLKSRGLVELGNDAPTVAKGPEAVINEKDLKQDIANAIQQLGG